MLRHGGLLSVAFCPSVRLCQNTRKKVTRKKIISQEPFDLWSPNFVKVKGHKRPRSGSKVKVTINVKEKAGGLMPTSSCFIFLFVNEVQRSKSQKWKNGLFQPFLSMGGQFGSGWKRMGSGRVILAVCQFLLAGCQKPHTSMGAP